MTRKAKRISLLVITLATAAPIVAAMTSSQSLTVKRNVDLASSAGPRETFTGTVKVVRLFSATDDIAAAGAYVTFDPRARTAWHTHPRGQVLIVTEGVGRVQAGGDDVQEIRPGDVVRIAPGQKHWHVAAPNTAMTHLAIQEHLNGAVVEWMGHVTDEQYGVAPRPTKSKHH